MNFIKSILKSLKEALATNDEIKKLDKKYPRISLVFKHRLDRTKFTGLPLTIFGLIFLYVVLLLWSVTYGYIISDVIVSVDMRVSTLFYTFRNPLAVKVFLWITLLGKSYIVIYFICVISILLYLYRQYWKIIILWLVVVGSGGCTYVAKIFFHRPRPITAVVLESSNSFPSGHATIAVAFYGFLAYLIFKKLKKKLHRKALFVLLTFLFIAAIGFSRLYLGVHYLSDVLAGYLVGLLWLIIGIVITKLNLFQNKLK